MIGVGTQNILPTRSTWDDPQIWDRQEMSNLSRLEPGGLEEDTGRSKKRGWPENYGVRSTWVNDGAKDC
jgi:hypothetical protein